MTNREFFVAVSTGNITDEVKAFALDGIAKLDSKQVKASAKKADSNAPYLKAVKEFLAENPTSLASEIAQACEISTPKAVALAKSLVKSGLAVESETKIPKVGVRKVYTLA